MKIEPMERVCDTKAREVSTMVYAYVGIVGHKGVDDCGFMVGKEFDKHGGGSLVFTSEDANLVKSVGGLQKFVIRPAIYTVDFGTTKKKH